MEKNKLRSLEAAANNPLEYEAEIYATIVNSPFLKRKNEQAAADLAKLSRPLPWEKVKAETGS